MAAWVNGNLCGQGVTLEVNGQIMYTINMLAQGAEYGAGCGMLGRQQTFRFGTRVMGAPISWDNDRVWQLPLVAAPVKRLHLPLIFR